MFRKLAVLALAVAVVACGSDDDGPDIASPDQLALRIVSGDGQRAPVADVGSSVLAAFAPIQTLPDNILPEPLVARITVDGQAPSASVAPSGPLGPSLAVLPQDVAVTFRVVQPEGVGSRHCGASFIDAAIPDDSGYVVTYWERGTYAGTCRTEVRLVVDGVPRVDTVFTATFEPGPVTDFQVAETSDWTIAEIGDSLDLREVISSARDQHGNTISLEDVRALPDSAIAWEWYGPGDSPRVSGSGWQADVPDVAGLGYELRRTAIVVDNKNVFCWHFTANLDLTIHGHAPSSGVLRLHRIAEPEGFTYPEPLCSEYEGES